MDLVVRTKGRTPATMKIRMKSRRMSTLFVNAANVNEQLTSVRCVKWKRKVGSFCANKAPLIDKLRFHMLTVVWLLNAGLFSKKNRISCRLSNRIYSWKVDKKEIICIFDHEIQLLLENVTHVLLSEM